LLERLTSEQAHVIVVVLEETEDLYLLAEYGMGDGETLPFRLFLPAMYCVTRWTACCAARKISP
jgi:hypothetical protein